MSYMNVFYKSTLLKITSNVILMRVFEMITFSYEKHYLLGRHKFTSKVFYEYRYVVRLLRDRITQISEESMWFTKEREQIYAYLQLASSRPD